MSDVSVIVITEEVINVTISSTIPVVNVTVSDESESTVIELIEQGISGPPGPKGDQGDASTVPGPPGQDGLSPIVSMQGDQITVDGVITGPHLTGPSGQDGNDGQDGQSPVVGMQGDQITIDGVVTGPNLTGAKGEDGYTPVKGVDYFDGDPGAPGQNGTNGQDGAPGADGYTPIKGVDYFDGAPGADGHSPVVSMSGDQITVDGIVTGPHLTGPQGPQGDPGSDSPLGEAPLDGKQYARKDGTWTEVVSGGGIMATFNTTLNFNSGDMIASTTVSDPTITATKIIQAFYTDNLDAVAVLAMRVTERSRTDGVGFDVIGVAPQGAWGIYSVRIITSGT